MLKMLWPCLLFPRMNILSMKFIFINFTVRSEAVIRRSKVQTCAWTIYSYKIEGKKKRTFLNRVDLWSNRDATEIYFLCAFLQSSSEGLPASLCPLVDLHLKKVGSLIWKLWPGNVGVILCYHNSTPWVKAHIVSRGNAHLSRGEITKRARGSPTSTGIRAM